MNFVITNDSVNFLSYDICLVRLSTSAKSIIGIHLMIKCEKDQNLTKCFSECY